MKKLFTLALAVMMVSASVFVPNRAQALVGMMTGNVAVFVVGAVVTAMNSSVVVRCAVGPHMRHCTRAHVIHGVGGLVGLLLLDDEGSQNAVFTEVTSESVAKLKPISESQLEAYNHELAEINSVRQRIVSEVIIRTERGEEVKGSDVHQLWMDARNQDLISEDAFVVVEAISEQAAQGFSEQI